MVDLSLVSKKKGILSRLFKKLGIRMGIKRCLSLSIRLIFGKKSYSIFGIARGLSFAPEHVIQIIPEEKVYLGVPKSIDSVPLSAFGREKILSHGALMTIRNGTAVSINGNLTPEYRLITTYLFSPQHKHRLLHFRARRCFPRIFETNEEVANLTHELSSFIFHWMFQVLPRLHLIKKNSKIFIHNEVHFQKESLDLLEISKERMINAKDYDAVKTPFLVAPCAPYGVTKWSSDYLRQSFLPKLKKSDKKRRLYISRNDAARRHLLNEEEVFSCLEKYGFEKITLTPLSFKEQAEIFYNAEMIVGPHGGGFSHIVFCDPETKVLEFFSETYVADYYWPLSNLVSLSYFYLLGKGQSQKGREFVHDDFELNLKELEATLKLMIGS